MAKLKFIDIIAFAIGKLKMGSDTHFRHDKSGTLYTCTRRENYQHSRSEAQRAMRAAFGARSHAVKLWLQANQNPPSDAYLRLRHEFEAQLSTTHTTTATHTNAQHRYTRFRPFLMSRLPLP